MNKKELIKRLVVLKELLEKGGEKIDQEVIDEFSRLNSELINGKKIHSVYEITLVLHGKKQVYIGYTKTDLSKRLDSALSTSAADTGFNKLLRENDITKNKFYKMDGKIELIESFWLEKEARKFEKKMIQKFSRNTSIELLNERGY